MNKKIIFSVIVLALFSVLLTACDAIEATDEEDVLSNPVTDPGVVAEANLVPADQVTLGFAVSGRVAEILVEEGDYVDTDEVLARLTDVQSLEAQVLTAEAAVLEAEQALETLEETADLAAAEAQVELIQAQQSLIEAEQDWDAVDTDEFSEDLDDARIEMNDAEDDLEDAEEDLEAHEDLDEDNSVREGYEDDLEEAQQAYDEAVWAFEELQNQYDLAEAQLEAAQAALEDAERNVEDTQDGPDPDDLELAETNLVGAQVQLEAAESALSDAELTAPFAGQIVNVSLTENTDVAAGEAAFVLIDDSEWYLETNDLTEDEVVQIGEESSVTISFDALPDETFTGEIDSISEYFVEQYGDITYTVRIQLLESDDRLRWGMTAEVTFGE